MIRVLIVKMTSMGDVLHVLPALEDLAEHLEGVSVDWMVEESFADIPAWHPMVDRVIPVATRRWRRLSMANFKGFRAFLGQLRERRYDYIIDAQGLMKSALFSRFARLNKGGKRIGYSGDSIKESPAAWFCSKTVPVPRNAHAVERVRQLICGGLDGQTPEVRRSYGILEAVAAKFAIEGLSDKPSIFLFHGTTWSTKHLPESLWYRIAQHVLEQGYTPILAWGNDTERQRAERIAAHATGSMVLPKSSLSQLASALTQASGAIAVDTGLGHLAAALDIPCVSLYGATDSALTGTYGLYQAHLQAKIACAPCLSKACKVLQPGEVDLPCYATFSVEMVWAALALQISARKRTLGV